jgi:hypothetical protein
MAIPNVPKIIAGQIDAGTIIASQYYNNPNSAYNGAAAYYFQVDLINPSSQYNMDDSANTPYEYNFADIEAGMWIAEQTGKAWLITDVTVAGDLQSAQLTIKDVNLFLFMSEPATFTFTYNYPSGTGYAIIFELSEDGIPVLPSTFTSYSGVLTDSNYWFSELITRFQYRNLLKSHYNNSNSPNANYANYEVGQMVYLDNTGTFQVLYASDAAQVKKRFGVITSVNEPESGDLGVRPWGKIVGDLDLGAFTVGDALYYDDTVGAPFLTATEPASSAIPMYIKISDTTGMYITDMVGGGGDQIYISQVPNGTPTPEDVGGIDQGTLPENIGNGSYTLSEVIDQLLWPSICPTAPSGVPSISFTSSPADNSLFVIGETVDIDFTTGAANLGLWNTVDGSSQVYQGDITSSTLTGPNSLNQSLTVTNNNPENPSVTGHTIVAGSGAGNTWTLTTIFAAGTDPVDNYGVTCDGLAPGSTTKTSSIDFEGVYPVFRGTSASYSQVGDTWTDGWTPTQLIASGNWAAISDLAQSNPVSDLITEVNNNLDSNGLFSFESTSTQTEGFPVEQNFGEGTAGTPPRHRFAIPANISVGNIYVFAPGAGGGSWFVVNTWSTSTKTLLINGTSVTYTIYERSGTDAGATKFRVTFS